MSVSGGGAAAATGLPARGPAVRSLGLALPPAPMPLWRRGSARKQWRYVGVFSPELLLCVVQARIGPISRTWWAVARPDGGLSRAPGAARSG